jgi:hypothetical protein
VNRINWKFEFLLDFGLLIFGAFGLPYLIYIVGQQVFGDYEGQNGVESLYGDIFEALAGGSVPTWCLVLSPFIVVFLLRLGALLLRRRKRVNHVTN